MHSAGPAAAGVVVPLKVVVVPRLAVALKVVVVALRAATDPRAGRRPARLGLHKLTLKVAQRGTSRLRIFCPSQIQFCRWGTRCSPSFVMEEWAIRRW
ncbi:MAG: hypothetical protein ACHQX3_11760 [Nitrospirales bacterium]